MVPDLLAKESSQHGNTFESGSVETLRAARMLHFLELQSPFGLFHPK